MFPVEVRVYLAGVEVQDFGSHPDCRIANSACNAHRELTVQLKVQIADPQKLNDPKSGFRV